MNKFFKDGDVVLFQGDSVTDWNRDRNYDINDLKSLGDGYPPVFKKIYDALFPCNKVTFVNKGVSGDRIHNLLERYDEDFKSINPDFISIMIGVNNTWRAFDDNDHTSSEDFEHDYETLLKKIKSDLPKAKILIMEQFVIRTHPERSGWKDDIDPKRKITEKLAKKYADYYIPMHELINEQAENQNNGIDSSEMSFDGVHPAATGFAFIAMQMMKTLGII